MLFHATHRHTHETCSAHNPENQKKFEETFGGAEKTGVKVHGYYVDAPGHAVYMILEADTALQISKFFDPILELGDTEIRPVADAMELLKQLRE